MPESAHEAIATKSEAWYDDSMIPQLADRLAGIASSAIDHAPQRAIEAVEALRRLHNGTYGNCVDCGGPIAQYRLIMRPEAVRCGHCQYHLNQGIGIPEDGF